MHVPQFLTPDSIRFNCESKGGWGTKEKITFCMMKKIFQFNPKAKELHSKSLLK
jgi:hypothetical protein